MNENDQIMLLSEVAKIKEQEYDYNRYSTGIFPMDAVLNLKRGIKGGFASGDVVIIAAPTGNGKTTLAMTLSTQLMSNEGLPSLWFTYEVSAFNLWNSFAESGVKPDELICVPFTHTNGKLEWIEQKIKEAKAEFFVKVVVIDHLGFLMPTLNERSLMTQNYSAYLTQIVRELKTIAIRESIIIILPVHMVKSAGEDLTLRDIGHSGGIAQEADVVILMAREENPRSSLTQNYYSDYTKVTLAKNRVGGDTPTWWMKKVNGKLVETFKENPNVQNYT